MAGINILGTGRYIPEYVVKNDDFAAFLDTSDEWITTRTGMSERRISLTEPTWAMGVNAAREAIKSAGISASDIDMIIGTTVTPDYFFPSMSSLVMNELMIEDCVPIDLNVACTGLAISMDMARRYLMDGTAKRILLVCAESMSQYADYTDRATCVLFGDAAGAMVVEASDKRFISFMNGIPVSSEHLHCKRQRQPTPFCQDVPKEHTLAHMNGREIYKFTIKAIPEAVEKVCERAGVNISDISMIFAHQANARILETAAKNLDISLDKFYMNIHRYGNTSSATIATCFDECVREGKIKRGDTICFVGFGAGLIYAANILEY